MASRKRPQIGFSNNNVEPGKESGFPLRAAVIGDDDVAVAKLGDDVADSVDAWLPIGVRFANTP